MRHATTSALLLLGAAGACLCAGGRASAGEGRNGKARERKLLKLLERARSGVVLLETATGVASGVVLDPGKGTVATSKARLEGAGAIEAYVFVRKVTEHGRVVVKREPLGPAEVVAVHRTADAAVLRVPTFAGLSPLETAKPPPAPGSDVIGCGVQGAVRFAHAMDLDVREGKVLGTLAADLMPLTAPTHVNSAGGAVLDDDGRLVGIASFIRLTRGPSFVLPKAAFGAAVPLGRFRELFAGSEHELSREEAAAYLAPRKGLPSHLTLSPGGPEGERRCVGLGVVAIREARAVVASGVFILDEHDPLEYFACPLANGKLHETAIATHASPAVINAAMIYLGYDSVGGVEKLGDPRRPLGDHVLMYVEWDHGEALAIREYMAKVDPPWRRPKHKGVREKVREGVIKWEPGPVVRARAEDLMFDRVNGRPMERTHWVYTGSSLSRDPDTRKYYYKATAEGVLAAVYRDPSAVFNIPLEGAEDDVYYCVDDTIVPPRGTSCTLIILPAPGKQAAPEGKAAEGAK